MLLDIQRWSEAINRRFPPRHDDDPGLIGRMEQAIASYVRGQLFLSLIIGVSTGVGIWILGRRRRDAARPDSTPPRSARGRGSPSSSRTSGRGSARCRRCSTRSSREDRSRRSGWRFSSSGSSSSRDTSSSRTSWAARCASIRCSSSSACSQAARSTASRGSSSRCRSSPRARRRGSSSTSGSSSRRGRTESRCGRRGRARVGDRRTPGCRPRRASRRHRERRDGFGDASTALAIAAAARQLLASALTRGRRDG